MEARCEELESKVKDLEESSERSLERINRYDKEVSDLKVKINQLEMENRSAVGLEFEFEQHKNKSKRRETELLDALHEKEKELNKLERSLQTITTDKLNNSKEEIEQISRNLNKTESICTNCKDFQRILSGKQQLIEDFERLKLDNQRLHSNIEKISAEAESAKLKTDSLETENTSLKKDNEHLTSLHGTLENIQKQIECLQLDKFKLESVKIDLEVMSKETANKIAEKTNLTQEIQTLNAHRDNLAAERDKLQEEIDLTCCTKEELGKIRMENELLNIELQKIKTNLEITQENYDKLLAENQTKTDGFEKLNMEVISARSQLKTLQSEYDDIQKKYEQIQADCNKHEGTIGEIQSEYESIQNKYQCLQKEYEKLENDSVQSFADCDRVQTQNENLETEIRELKTKVEEAQRKLLENESLQQELESLKSDMNRLQEEYEQKLSASISNDKKTDLQAENSKLKEELKSLQLRFDEMQKEYDDTSTQLVDTISDYETLLNEMKSIKAADVGNLADDFEAMKMKSEKLEADNLKLVKDNNEWNNTIMSMTESLREKCEESERLHAQLKEFKNESNRSESPRKSLDECIQFLQLAESILEIEITLGNGGAKIFQAVGEHKCSNGRKLIIGNIGDITQGTFNELRGAIDFVISNDVHKLGNEIFDSLEMENHTSSPNSCDSLEGPSRQSNEDQYNELLEERSKLFESVRELQETVAFLKSELVELESKRQELKDTRLIVETLKSENSNLSDICEENKYKISELSEIISRAESENMKLIADCEQLKKTVESEGTVENDSRENFEELKQQHEEMRQKLAVSEKCVSELREQILTLNAISSNKPSEGNSKEDLKDLKLESIESDQTNGNQSIVSVSVKEEVYDHADMNGELVQSNEQNRSDKTVKYEKEISNLQEELENEKSKYQEVANQINDLQKKFEERDQESSKSAGQIEDLNIKLTKLQTEYDELLSFERMKSTELEESVLRLEKLNKECNHLQESVFGLKETVQQLEEERNSILHEKKALEKKTIEDLNEKLNDLKEETDAASNEKNVALPKSIDVDQEKEEIVRKYQNLQEEIEKLQENKIYIEDQLNLEISKAQNKNSSMRQDIDELKEKLQSTEIALEKINSEKDELEDKLTSNKQYISDLENACEVLKQELADSKKNFLTEANLKQTLENELQIKKNLVEELSTFNDSLVKKCSELEEKSKVLEQQIAETKQTFCDDKHQFEILQKENEKAKREFLEVVEDCSKKGDLITKLTDENKSLDAKFLLLKDQFSLLEKQFENTKCSLASEVKLKEELIEDQSKKDNLITQLSNENRSSDAKISELEAKLSHIKEELKKADNSLSTKSTVMEEKLASLEDQLEESKRTLSSEVSRLNEILAETNASNSAQSSKIDDLLQKIKSFENDRNVAQKTASEKDSLMHEINQMQKKYDELESLCAVLKQDLADSERSLLTETNMKQALESQIESKVNLVEQLSKTNDALQTKCSELEAKCKVLEQQVAETKQTLSGNKHQLEISQNEIEKSKHELRRLVEESSKKDDLITELSNKNKSLTAKIFEVESACTVLKQELAESKQTLLTEINMKQALESECRSKDDFVTQLSKTNGSLETKCSKLEENCKDLEQQVTETKQTLCDNKNQLEISQNEIEKSKRELLEFIQGSSKKDNLITELTNENKSLEAKILELNNKLSLLEKQFEDAKCSLAAETQLKHELEKNNNSLSTKNTELEKRLATLENKFEESKRNLSSEVISLNKVLAETNAANNAQISKIDDLLQKIKSCESDLKVAQETASEKDYLLQKVQEEYNLLALKHANLDLSRSSFEAELNSAREVVVENTALVKKVHELQNSIKEIQLKCDSLKCSNDDLELANKTLTEQLRDAVQHAEECNRLKSELLILREEVKKEQTLKNKFSDELKSNLKEWESKNLLISNQISQLQNNVHSLTVEKNKIEKEFQDTVKKNSEKVSQLEELVQSLQKDQSINLSKTSISPRKEKGMEHWMSETHQLKIKNMCLMDKLDSNQKSSPNEERKNRRLSTHDERRIQSFWDSNRDVSTMTDPTNTECSCAEMNLKLNELKQRLLIRDSQVNTLSMELKNHPLKTENATLKKLFAEEESKQQQLRKEIKKYKTQIVNRTNESKHCAKCAEFSKRIFVDSFSQTTDSDESECYRKLLSKYEDLKIICRVRHNKMRELEDALSKGKENANNDNITSLHNQQYKQKYEQIKKELNVVQAKYEEVKILCNRRYEQLKALSNQPLGNS